MTKWSKALAALAIALAATVIVPGAASAATPTAKGPGTAQHLSWDWGG